MAATDSATGTIDLDDHVDRQIHDFRRQLLGLTLRNSLLSCPHGEHVKGQIRIVHELHDEVFSHFDRGEAFEVMPLPEPRDFPDDEEDEEFQQALAAYKKNSLAYELALKQLKQSNSDAGRLEALDREARDHVRLEVGRGKWEPQGNLEPAELANRHGIDPSFDLASPDKGERMERYYDDALQTLLPDQELARRLRQLSQRAGSDLRDRGVHTLFAAFGFLEWYEDPTSQKPHLAPLVLVPLELEKVSRNNRRTFVLRKSSEQPIRNAALAEDLGRRFDLELPDLDADDTPESYFRKIEPIFEHQQRWRLRRFLTIQIFSDAKLAIYADLDPDIWPDDAPLSGHGGVRQLMSKVGVGDADYAADHDIDGDEAAARLPTLIYDADSSQHSAIVDVMRGGDVTIYGPPGTGKSQTITNLIAAAMDAGKSILFVAEKLTALDVVHKRLSEAGLDPYCFVLHSRGVRRGAVLDALRQRVNTTPPNFNEAAYQSRRKLWEDERDALKLYASVMGDRLGALGLTVHETLWAEIGLREQGDSLPPSVATVRLPEARVLALTADDLQRIQGELTNLASAYRALGEPGAHPWRGIEGQELAPPELQPTQYRLAGWQEAVSNLASAVTCLSGDIEPLSLESIAKVKRATALLADHAELTRDFDLKPLARDDARLAVIAAARAAKAASKHAHAMREEFGLDPSRLPSADEVREMASEASALDCAQIPASEIGSVAEKERRKAHSAVRVRSALEQLYRLFGISEPDAGAAQITMRAMERIRLTAGPLLLARTDLWVGERARKRLTELRASVEEVLQEREALAQRFDMDALPAAKVLRDAGRQLERAGWLSRTSRRAAKLHKRIASKPRRTTTEAKAAELLRLAEHVNAAASLKDDDGGKELIGPGWRGADSDLRGALEVSDWAAAVAAEFAGVGSGHAEIRHALLHGDIDVLNEVANIAAGLEDLTIGDFVGAECTAVSDPDELYALANRAEGLACRVERSGLPQERPLVDVENIAEAIERYQENLDAANECPIARREDGAAADGESLAALARLSHAIEQKALGKDWWRAAVELDTEVGSQTLAAWILNTESAIELEDRAWRSWAGPLQVAETEFFDGMARKSAPLDALQRRAEECLNGGKTILQWCRYRRTRNEIFDTEARPVLLAFERAELDIEQLSIAFALAVYRSLASIVFRKHPDLQKLTGQQLRNHKQAFENVEEQLQNLERLRIADRLYRGPVEHGISLGPESVLTERALVNQQLGLKPGSRGVSPRELMHRAGKAMRQLKPCFMMSPTTVAELLPRTSGLFDLVVIDEASQVLPADALGAIARGKNAIVVGDPLQLPPTTFFQGGQVAGDGDGPASASESILDLAMSAWRPHRYLRWHYRSRHSALIQFSNAKFYQNRMIVFPSPHEDQGENGINFRYVEDGIYRGDRTNEHEVEQVADAVLRFVSNRDNWERSLAVVTMNQPQRDALDEALDKAATSHNALAGYIRRWENTLEPFSIKNLETVQGDERDVIFISTVYGPQSPGGPVLQTFGPITQQGGERRLNVLFTRARWRIDVFSSMRAEDIQRRPGQSRGVQILRDYLEYAATGRIEGGVVTGMPTESPFEQHVKERLEAAGYDATPQVGVASYRIDLGVKHPDYPHGFILGVECDGATYHSARSVRDRDRLREAVLRDLGWDIYRIWSTDWFDDPDREMEKLVDYLNARLAKLNSGQEAEDPDLAGAIVDEDERGDADRETPGETELVSTEGVAEDELYLEADTVEVGDTVYYRPDVEGSDIRKVVIVGGADDPDRGLINDAKPLARAVLGRCRGETVTVRQPNSRLEVVIERIVKKTPQADGQSPWSAQLDVFAGHNFLQPYPVWRGTAPDPRAVSTRDLAESLRDIVEIEGPIVTERIYRAYIRASTLQRAGRQVRKLLNKALGDLERRKIVTIVRPGTDNGYAGATVRLTNSSPVVLRDRGDRDLTEIPTDELAQMYRLVRSESPGEDEEKIRREVLTRYGLTRITARVRERLSEAARRPHTSDLRPSDNKLL
ncbi:MAG: DUF4011 domain-containing protein [Rhodospirillaceae bacterium]|nr:DUF4011 domain-containing protein [Rhodospirillaceae bacterium]